MKKHLLTAILIFIMIIPAVCFGENMTGDELSYSMSGFYSVSNGTKTEIDTISEGEILCRYIVANGDEGSRDVTVLACLFHSGTMMDIVYSTKTVPELRSRVFENTLNVSEKENAEIKVYVIEDINKGTPLIHAMTLNSKSRNNMVKAFEIDGIEGVINHTSGRIDIKVPYETNLGVCVPEIELAPGASYSLSDSDFTVPVTLESVAENGEKRSYNVYAKKDVPVTEPVVCDFESETLGEVPSGWELAANNSGTAAVTTDPENPENQVVRIDDTGDNAVTLSLNMNSVYYPFQVEFRINSGHDGAFSKPNADVSYNMAIVGTKVEKKSSICGLGYIESAKGVAWMARSRDASGNGVDIGISDVVASINKWYNIKMIYRSDYMVEYYVDDEYIATVPANAQLENCKVLWLTTSTSRKSRMYFDDLRITHIKDSFSSLNLDFEDMTTGEAPDGVLNPDTAAVVCETADGKAVSLCGTSVGWSIGQVKNGAALELDILEDEENTDTGVVSVTIGENVGFGMQTDSDGNLVLTDYSGNEVIAGTVLENGVNHRMRLEVFKNESTGYVLYAVYADGVLAYVSGADETDLGAGNFSVEATGANPLVIDNVVFKAN